MLMFQLEWKTNLNAADNPKIYFKLNFFKYCKCFDLIQLTFYIGGYKFHLISFMLHDNQRSFFIVICATIHNILETSNMRIWDQF